jgi:BirA family biotin operon repressor/biotin-[acetyl-CoA-carboxylase] ligase
VSVERPRISRLERFGAVDSTQQIVAGWLDAGEPEICVAVADEQTAGRGRRGRSWTAPPGSGLLLSLGFRPPRLRLRHGWRLGAAVAIAMAEAAETALGLFPGRIGLKWPNDLVDDTPPQPRKLGGVLGETVVDAENDLIAHAVVGIGVNADWAAEAFPPDLAATMTSLRELAGGPVDREQVLAAFLDRIPEAYAAFDAAAWGLRQRTTGSEVEVATHDGVLRGLATGVDPDSGVLLLDAGGERRAIDSGDVIRCRLVGRRGGVTARLRRC